MLKVVCGKAAEITVAYGHRLVGATVFTSVVGKWNGGMARVIEIQPDAEAPEIPLQIKHCDSGEEIGVFGDEFLMVEFETIGPAPAVGRVAA